MSKIKKGTERIIISPINKEINNQNMTHDSNNFSNDIDYHLETPASQCGNLSMISKPDSNTNLISKNNIIKEGTTASTTFTMPNTKKLKKKKNLLVPMTALVK